MVNHYFEVVIRITTENEISEINLGAWETFINNVIGITRFPEVLDSYLPKHLEVTVNRPSCFDVEINDEEN